MKKVISIFLTIISVTLIACILPPAQKDRKYENDNFLNFPGQEIEKTASAAVFLETTVRVKTPDGKTAVSGGGGRGLILSHQGNNYILTASHVVNPTLASPGAEILAAILEPLESSYLLKIKEPLAGSDESNTEFKIKPSNVGLNISDPGFSAEEKNSFS